MLGRLRMSTREALAEYNRVAKCVFSKENKKRMTQDGMFKETTLEAEVQKLVASKIPEGPSAKLLDPAGEKTMGRACVPPAQILSSLSY